ncbi:MAG: sigma-E processing peptidase SpoIIGA [Oscillospiraceae bacterium]|nr:sigma-E processing peptidase SpoIIGA [Oscillospiraceae bacterium]
MLWAMETVYADALFLLNAALDYLLLLSVGKLCALPLRRLRLALGALWGGAYALLALLRPGLFGLLSVKLLAGALAVVIAFGLSRRTARAVLVFYAVSAAFAGAVYAAATLAGREPGNGLWVDVSPRVLLLSFALCYAAVTLVFRRAGRRAERRIHTVTLRAGGRECSFPVLEDSGNELADPVSGSGVLVAEATALAPLFPGAALTEPDPLRALEQLNAAGPARWRLLGCSCVAARRTLLPCFRPESLKADGRERRDLLVALAPGPMSPDGEYQGIIPP